MTKPFAFSELLARVQALIRRAGGLSEPTQLVVGNLTMNLLSREVVREGEGSNCSRSNSPCLNISCAIVDGWFQRR